MVTLCFHDVTKQMLIIDINNRKIYNKDSQFKICLVIKNMTFIYIKLLDVNIQYHWCIDKSLNCFGEKTLYNYISIFSVEESNEDPS